MNGAFEIVSGAIESPLILHIPHSSRHIPPEVREEILLDDESLELELDAATDSLTDLLGIRAVDQLEGLRPTLFINRASRFVIDPERFPDEREAMNRVGMGAVYLKTTSGAQLRVADFESADLLDRYFHPYAAALTTLTEEMLDRHGRAIIIDLHSYRAQQQTNAINHGQRRPAICIGTDPFHTPRGLSQLFFDEFGVIGDCFENEPYAGTYVPLKHYGKDHRVSSVMLETRADTFLDEALTPHSGFDLVAAALSRILSRINSEELGY